MKNCWKILFVLLITSAIGACKKPYSPTIITQAPNYLVVEGFINNGDSTTIKLSRTVQLSDTAKSKPELGAVILVEDNLNNHYQLAEIGNGVYKSAVINLSNAQTCRLHIITTDKKEYASDMVEIDKTPPIDTITHAVINNGIQMMVSTHDAANKVKYFRWDFTETWEYGSYYNSRYKYVNGAITYMTPDDYDNICWINGNGNQILVGSAENLSQSVINNQIITFVDESTGKLALGYSILIKQYALTKEAFEYWQKLKKNTEQLGSIFDAQPSDLKGNLHNLNDANEPVMGYISASNTTNKRFIIGHNSIPLYTPNYYPPPNEYGCVVGHLPFDPADTYNDRLNRLYTQTDSIIYTTYGSGPVTLGYQYAYGGCVDCRLKIQGGYNKKPAYWPDVLP
ncbi:DUF4249 domain-containing protein [Mucilaginibacter jinjuensis]|uniref:DUF4249 domain-containing protein n=1 Tax=Mucilaginibacter jinjuensis TaxID=1176721 RepID=A0ABY7T737_9SPHI|nr:DUF4249 domain-containing protein [Mucilaginibacter jinjuensis]WCT12093.1 DUF4249 domain-containing protein [Mucilaginibacter jinjuensis]